MYDSNDVLTGEYTYTHNADGILTRIDQNDGAYKMLTYSGDYSSVTINYYNTSATLTQIAVIACTAPITGYELNSYNWTTYFTMYEFSRIRFVANGRTISVRVYNASMVLQKQYDYTYNGSNQLIQYDGGTPGSVLTTTYQYDIGGNLSKAIESTLYCIYTKAVN